MFSICVPESEYFDYPLYFPPYLPGAYIDRRSSRGRVSSLTSSSARKTPLPPPPTEKDPYFQAFEAFAGGSKVVSADRAAEFVRTTFGISPTNDDIATAVQKFGQPDFTFEQIRQWESTLRRGEAQTNAEDLTAAFRAFDTHHHNYITTRQLRVILMNYGDGLTSDEADTLVQTLNLPSRIDYTELARTLCGQRMFDMSNSAATSENDEAIKRLRLDSPPDPTIPRLYYFDARGRSEIIRLVFALRGVHYEDLRFRTQSHAMADFELLKKHRCLPFEQVPLLEIDGLSIVQSQAILRYLGRKYSLMGKSEKEAVKTDMIGCAAEDLRQRFTTSVISSQEPEARAFMYKFRDETCPRWGRFLERLLVQNGGVWFVGDDISYADLVIYDLVTAIRWRLDDAFKGCVKLNGLVERVESIPEIKKWIENRPPTSI